MQQKVIQVGNSLAVVLPSAFAQQAEIKAGQNIHVLTDASSKTVVITQQQTEQEQATMTPEFFSWLKQVTKHNSELIKQLARI